MNSWILWVLVIIVLFSCSLTTGVSSFAIEPTGNSSGLWVTGYYVAYQYDLLPPEKIEWSGLTHIVMGRIKANNDGTIDESFDIGSPDGPELARKISKLAHKNNKKAILMLGGDDNGKEILSAVRDHQDIFITNLLKTMNTYGYDGLDLDWEGNDVNWDLFETFAKKLRSAANTKILTLPVGTINANYESVNPHIVTISKYMDRVSVMSYYPATAWAGEGWLSWYISPLKGAKPTTPISIEDTLARYVKAGVPKNKLQMGIGFYAIGYQGGITGPNQPTSPNIIVGGDNDYPLTKLFGSSSAYNDRYRKWDLVAQEPYLSLPIPDSYGSRYVSFEDDQSILAKGAFARSKGYGGAIIWTINQGYVPAHASPHFLMKALRKGFIDPNTSQTVAISIFPKNIWVRRGETITFRSLVTGTTNKGVTWKVQEPKGGVITQKGDYTAPPIVTNSSKKTYHIIATSRADPTKIARSSVIVADNKTQYWDPGLTRHNCAEWWMEVYVQDKNTTSLEVEHDGIITQMSDWTFGKLNFKASIEVKKGETIRYHAYNADGRKAITVPISYTITKEGEEIPCPIEKLAGSLSTIKKTGSIDLTPRSLSMPSLLSNMHLWDTGVADREPLRNPIIERLNSSFVRYY